MGMMNLPFGAWRILEARKHGKKPADMVLVSLIGKLENEANPVVQALPGATHDWSWCRGLIVCFWTTPKEYEPQHLLDCDKAEPKEIYLWDCANEKGYDIYCMPKLSSVGLPRKDWDCELVQMRWTPGQEKRFAAGELVWN